MSFSDFIQRRLGLSDLRGTPRGCLSLWSLLTKIASCLEFPLPLQGDPLYKHKRDLPPLSDHPVEKDDFWARTFADFLTGGHPVYPIEKGTGKGIESIRDRVSYAYGISGGCAETHPGATRPGNTLMCIVAKLLKGRAEV